MDRSSKLRYARCRTSNWAADEDCFDGADERRTLYAVEGVARLHRSPR